MVELGSPFSQPYQALIASLEQSLREGVEQPVTERIIFQSTLSAYDLRYPAVSILRVSGLVGGRNFTVFTPDVHFRLSNNRILWLHATEKPVDGGRLEVQYTYRERPSGLTDFNPGSVVGTLVRALARELKLLYEQMDQAYRRAFIDEATGVGLDSVVALLGVTRNSPIKAQGEVTFFLKAATNRNVLIPAGTRVEDAAKRAYVTTAAGQIEPLITETSRLEGDAVVVKNQVASKRSVPEIEGIWRKLPNSEQISGEPLVTAATLGLGLSDDKRSLLFGAASAEVRALLAEAGPLLVRYKSTSVTVPVVALAAGLDGNVNSGAIMIMPTPPPGVDGVLNETPITGGQSAESDEQLRDRAKHALERKGNATLNAIKFAVLDVDGVEGVEVVDHSVDGSIPVGEVRVRYSGGDDGTVQEVVEQTRAAGILARLEKINEVLVSGVLYVLAGPPTPDTAAETLRDQAIETIEALAIGQGLSLRRLSALAYAVNGLAEVAEVQLVYRKADPANPGETLSGMVVDPFLPAATELVRPDAANLAVSVLSRLAAARRAGTQAEVEVSLLDSAGQPAHFGNFAVDLSVTLRARLANAPEQPPEVVGRFTRTATFVDSSHSTLSISQADAPQLRTGGADAHDITAPIQVTVSLAAFAGIQGASAIVDFSPGALPAPLDASTEPPGEGPATHGGRTRRSRRQPG
jgi:uncharacterized phage protein gp47/JayE